jgi:DNA-binding GntR family transcriptional regulator
MSSPAVPTAADRAYSWTRRAVLTGELESGALITEREVAEAVGVSRTPVREAFLQLQAEGVLRLYPKRGALVVPVSSQEVADVVDARLLIETWAFGRMATAAGHDRLAGVLSDLVDEQERCRDAGDDAGFQEADRAFHAAVVDKAGNALVRGFYASLSDRQVRLGAQATRIDGARGERILAEHREIAGALARGEAAETTRLVRAHIEATAATLGR